MSLVLTPNRGCRSVGMFGSAIRFGMVVLSIAFAQGGAIAAGPGGSAATSSTSAVTSTPSTASTSAAPSNPAVALPPAAEQADVLMIGEVHDNAAQHALRADWLRQLAQRRPFALVMEQLDVGAQPAIDQALREQVPARELAQRAGFRFAGWQWDFYAPYIDIALSHHWPLLAANLPSADVMAIARGKLDPPAVLNDPAVQWQAADQTRMADDIRTGHCGMLPETALPMMVTAQRARDAQMALVVLRAHQRSGLPVVLLAGNGHVRGDLGVPRYLKALWPEARVVTIGVLEPADGAVSEAADASRVGRAPYDVKVTTPAQTRDDPCQALRNRSKTLPAG